MLILVCFEDQESKIRRKVRKAKAESKSMQSGATVKLCMMNIVLMLGLQQVILAQQRV